ncbi:MAG: Bug family tripartite tricarboxylate transporter substrate binding protein [Alphaproteobacteria bacterium]
MSTHARGVAAILSAIAGLAFPAVAAADAVADFYKGKSVSFIVGHEAGTGYDSYARALGRHMGRHIGGNPGFVVQNMPGASGLNAANWLYNVAAKDGSVIATMANTAPFEPLLGRGAAQFDPVKFGWIGNMDENVGICGVWHTTGITSFDQLLQSDLKFGATTATSPFSQSINALRNILGAKFSGVEGYSGANAVKLALARGEVFGACGISLSSLQTQWKDDLDAKRFVPLAHFAVNPRPDLVGVKHIYDYAKTDEQRQLFDLIFGRHMLGRPVLAPPNLPEERKAALRKAFLATMKDAAFLADAEKMKLDIGPTSGEEIERFIARFFDTPRDVVEKANRVVQKN